VTDDERALLRMIRDHPDADLPRLVYADWLEERGREARAEFIRVQIDRYRRIPTDPTARGISWREYQILEEYELAWKAELPPGFRTGSVFRRGLIHRASCRVADLFAATENDLAAPIEELFVTVDEVNIEWLAVVPPAFRLPLRELTISCQVPVGPVLAEFLIRCGPYPHLQTLRIFDPVFGNTAVQSLPPLPAFPKVQHLDLSGCWLNEFYPDVVVNTGWMDQLERLSLGVNHRGSDAVSRLRRQHPNVRID
jgi:uncharacterized protein (TIGR02996 family)